MWISSGSTYPIIVAGIDPEFFGSDPFAISSESVYPSPSSSVSVTSGVPSLSVSLCTVILNVLVAIFPVGSLASTVTVNSFVSSFGPQLFTAGVLLILLPVYVTPFGIPETVTVAVGSSVVTVISEIALPSTTV